MDLQNPSEYQRPASTRMPMLTPGGVVPTKTKGRTCSSSRPRTGSARCSGGRTWIRSGRTQNNASTEQV